MLAQAYQGNIVYPISLWKHQLWANITQVVFLSNVVSNVFGQHWIDNIPFQCCPSMVDTTLYRLFYWSKFSVSHEPTLHILFNVVVILLRQHCTDKSLVQCYPRDSRQQCTWKNSVHCLLNNIIFRQFLFWTG